MARKFTFKVPGSKIKFRVVEFTVHEWISSPYMVNLKLATTVEADFKNVVAKEAVLTIWGNDQSEERYFHGIINQFVKTGNKGRFFLYEAMMVPDLWRLTLMQDCRIFQGLPVLRKKDGNPSDTPIVEQILNDANIMSDRYDIRTQELYDKKDYCSQYRETDLTFISRLIEEEGIFYFFEHSKNKHLLVFGDSTVCYKPIPGTNNEVEFHPPDEMVSEEDFVYNFRLSQQVHSGKVSLRDFDFLNPSNFPIKEAEDSYKKLEIYDYPGGYIKDESGSELDKATIKNEMAKIRLQEAALFRERAEGESICPRFAPGHTFKLTKHDELADPEYVLTEVIHSGRQPQSLGEQSGSRDGGFSYTNRFVGIPSSTPFRPQRKTPKAIVRGPQTAIVIDSQGKTDYDFQNPQAATNIYTDSHGRVKVRFHWERPHKDKTSQQDIWNNTAWVRVSQAWAGQGWGAMHIPHVGQEVIVDFLEGDPDRPIITGRVYNGANMPHNNNVMDTMNPSVDPHISGFRDEYGNKLLFDANTGKERVVLKSPNHDSYLSLGKDGAELKTNADVAQRVIGNIIEAGCGTKFEAVFGLELAAKLAQVYEFAFGQKFELFAGNKIGFGFGTDYEYKLTKDLKAVEGDIEHECKKDYKLTAGDGLCIVGGTRDESSQNHSVFSSFADGIMLSLGAEQGTKTAKADLGKITWGITGVAMVLGAIFAVLAKAFDAVGAGTDTDEYTFGDHTFSSLIAITALTQTILAVIIGYKARDSIEPSYHEDPLAVFGINKSGITFGIRPDLLPAKQQLAAIRQQINAKKALKSTWNISNRIRIGKELDSLKDQEREIWKKFIQTSLGKDTTARSKIMMNKDGSININSNGRDEVVQGQQIQGKKEIELSIGDPNNKKTLFLMDKDGVAIGDGQSKTLITVLNDDEIHITTIGKKITINAGSGDVEIKGSKVDIAGSAFTSASVDILKALKVIQ
ncbi:MAG: type VI secretion system tip protein VgrG [Deltaproteobacteria bacterium]|nr:type VI secretion system tip protein VgrG [Deltaproteobacteria bacterium]